MNNRPIFEFLTAATARDQQCVLVTVIAVTGSSMRNPGAHMAVAADGSFAGSLSGGCIESAVVAEALEVLASGESRITRFGEGSRYLDIRLPCGGGLDLLFQPLEDDQLALQCIDAIDRRQAFMLQLPLAGGKPAFHPDFETTRQDETQGLMLVGHQPVARLLIIGHGASVASTARLGRTMQMDITVHSPDRDLVAHPTEDGNREDLANWVNAGFIVRASE